MSGELAIPLLPAGLSDELQTVLSQFAVAATGDPSDRVKIVQQLLETPAGRRLRADAARWVVDSLLPVEELVPDKYVDWRPPVRDAMIFVVEHLSPERLAPKLVEQFDLPPNTPAAQRLLKLIARVPGLQKVGQVIARNRHLRPSLKAALAKLENGIRDVGITEIRATVREELGEQFARYKVRISPKILSEASVSAVVRFTWINPANGRREPGVFKVLKAHVPKYFAEDMQILQDLADFFGRYRKYDFAAHLIPDTFRKVRRHLQREVDFPGEQRSLVEAKRAYRFIRSVRVPAVIPVLCTPTVTALSEERGIKVTSAARAMKPERRRALTEQLITALVAFPLFSSENEAVFHGDPHAGNLLYDTRKHELVLLDWALTEHLSREQRRHLLLLFLALTMRNRAAASADIAALAQNPPRPGSREERAIKKVIAESFSSISMTQTVHAVDAMKLLEDAALRGVRFPSSLVMFSKVLFTLDGILNDIGGEGARLELTMILHALRTWLKKPISFGSPLRASDWLRVEFSALLYCGQVGVHLEDKLAGKMFAAR